MITLSETRFVIDKKWRVAVHVEKSQADEAAEIPMLRSELNLLSGLFEEFGELIRDPDSGLELRPEIRQRLSESSSKPKGSLLTSEGILGRLGC